MVPVRNFTSEKFRSI